jgi:hypothetical protein
MSRKKRKAPILLDRGLFKSLIRFQIGSGPRARVIDDGTVGHGFFAAEMESLYHEFKFKRACRY